MIIRRLHIAGLACAISLGWSGLAAAQNAAEAEERSRFIRFIENQVSSPNMQVRLIGADGVLSTDIRFDRITVSDEDGVWLSIEEPRLVWQRSALLRGRLQIEELAADSLTFTRPPNSGDSRPSPESRGFAIPELPVAVNIEELDLPRAAFGEDVFGLESELSLAGSFSLADGDLAADLAIVRLDGPGGTLDLDVTVENDALQIDAALTEPADGVVANLLNIADRPPVSLAIRGGGAFDALDIDLALDVGGSRVLDGNLETSRARFSDRTALTFGLEGPIASILPVQYEPFFGGRSRIDGQVLLDDDGDTIIETISVDGGALSLDASGRLLPDGFPIELDIDAALAPDAGETLVLPGGETTTIASAAFDLDYGGSDWTLDARMDDLRSAARQIGTLTVAGRGALEDIADPENRALTYQLITTVRGLTMTDADMQQALGEAVDLGLRGDWQTGAPLAVDALRLTFAGGEIVGSGQIESATLTTDALFQSGDMSPFSGVAGRDLTGTARLSLAGTYQPIGGAFDVDIDGALRDLTAGDDLAGRLLAGDMTVTGGIARTTDGLTFDGFEGENAQIAFAADGRLASDAADLNAALSLADLAIVDAQSSGSVGLQIAVDRTAPEDPLDTDTPPEPFMISAQAMMPSGSLSGQAVSDLQIGLDGTAMDGEIEGAVSGAGMLAGQPLALAADLARRDEAFDVSGLDLRAGGARVTGDLAIAADGTARGALDLDADDIAALAALALLDASGRLDAEIELTAVDGRQDATIAADASNLVVEGTEIGRATVEAALSDLRGRPRGTAELTASGLAIGGFVIEALDADIASGDADGTFGFDARARIEGGANVDTEGTLAIDGGARRLDLARLDVDTPFGDARLAAPARIALTDGDTRIESLSMIVEGGRVDVSGRAGQTLALDVRLNAIPMAIANGFRPGLGAGGTLGGTASIRGTPADPRADFDLSADGFTLAAIGEAGIAPMSVRANGSLAGDTVRLATLTMSNGQQINVSASGTVPLTGGGLDVNASGTAPLSLANARLARRGTRLSGTLRFEARATGAVTSPNLSGLASVSGGSLTDPLANLQLNNISLLAGLEGDAVVIQSASADLSLGGRVTAAGRLGLGPTLPADLTIGLRNARYSDGQSFSTQVSGDLSLTGPMTGGALIAGALNLGATEITIAETFGGDAQLLEVTHIAEDAPTRRTLERLAAAVPRRAGSGPSAPYRLDVEIRAPNQVFVRGRGLDAELGGTLRVTGPLDALAPSGALNLIRGRLFVLDRRLDFTSGSVTLTGNLNPFLDLTAQTQSGDLTAFVSLRGLASDPVLELSSSPELPEDEILSRVLFGEDIASLSPLQLARLATAAGGLGGSGSGLAGGLREALGVDDLDVFEDSEGGIGVRAGRYLSDNVYLELESEAGGVETTINLDITDSLTARGSVDSGGDSSVGIFFERDY